CLARVKAIVPNARQLAGPAPQIDDAHPRDAPHERQQVEKRLLALALKPVVLARIPAVDHATLRLRPWSLVLRAWSVQESLVLDARTRNGQGTTDQERTKDQE